MCFRSKPFRHIHTSWPVVVASQCWCTSKQYTSHLHHQCNRVHIDVIRCGTQDSSSQTKTKVLAKRVLEPKQAQSPFDIVGVARAVDTTLGLRRLRLLRLLTWNKHVTKFATLPRFHVFKHLPLVRCNRHKQQLPGETPCGILKRQLLPVPRLQGFSLFPFLHF